MCGAHNLLRVEQSEINQCSGKLGPVHFKRRRNNLLRENRTNLGPVHFKRHRNNEDPPGALAGLYTLRKEALLH